MYEASLLYLLCVRSCASSGTRKIVSQSIPNSVRSLVWPMYRTSTWIEYIEWTRLSLETLMIRISVSVGKKQNVKKTNKCQRWTVSFLRAKTLYVWMLNSYRLSIGMTTKNNKIKIVFILIQYLLQVSLRSGRVQNTYCHVITVHNIIYHWNLKFLIL